jgi:hypothetical protein
LSATMCIPAKYPVLPNKGCQHFENFAICTEKKLGRL